MLLKLVIPIAVFTMIFSEYISDLLYGHGNMSKNSVGIFDRTKYRSDLYDLKDAVNELTKEIQEMKK